MASVGLARYSGDRETPPYQKGPGQSASRVRKAERGPARWEHSREQLPITQLFRPERAREATGGSKGHAVECGRDCLSR